MTTSGTAATSPGGQGLPDLLRRSLDDPELVVFEAKGPDDVRRIRREVEGRRWAASCGIPTAETVAKDVDDRWLVSRRVVDEPGESAAYVAAAIEMSRRIQRLPLPRFATPAATWKAPRRTFALRVARLVRAGIDPRVFAATRDAFALLPRDATVHHDYHRQNVLNTIARGHVTVIDWEMTAPGPRHHDAVMLIVDVEDPSLAEQAWTTLLESTPAADRVSLAVQLRWLALRTYAGEIAVAPGEREPAKRSRRRRRWADAQQWADDVAGPARRQRA